MTPNEKQRSESRNNQGQATGLVVVGITLTFSVMYPASLFLAGASPPWEFLFGWALGAALLMGLEAGVHP